MIESDFAVVGGSYGGLSAALQLARARRDVTVIDAELRRNRFVDEASGTSHGFLSRDGVAPGEFAALARRQLLSYRSVRWIEGTAEDAHPRNDGRFALRVAANTLVTNRLVLAIGVRDEMPDIAGLSERWGRSVFHCPYSHGYEMEAVPSASSQPRKSPAITPSCCLTGAPPRSS